MVGFGSSSSGRKVVRYSKIPVHIALSSKSGAIVVIWSAAFFFLALQLALQQIITQLQPANSRLHVMDALANKQNVVWSLSGAEHVL